MNELLGRKNFIFMYQDVETGVVQDITSCVSNVSVTTSIDGNCGKVELDILVSQNDTLYKLEHKHGNTLIITNDSWEPLTHNGSPMFYGFLFIVETSDITDRYHLTFYDQKRYLKNTTSLTVLNKTLYQIFTELCTKFEIPYFCDLSSQTKLEEIIYEEETLYNILDECIKQYLIMENEQYILRCEGGVLTIKRLRDCCKNYKLKVDETIMSYKYKSEVDSKTYTIVEDYTFENKSGGKMLSHIRTNYELKNKLGILKKSTDVSNCEYTDTQIQENVLSKIQLYSLSNIEFSITAVGLCDIKAGDLIQVQAPSKNFNSYTLYLGEIIECTHNIQNDDYTMDLTIRIVGEDDRFYIEYNTQVGGFNE